MSESLSDITSCFLGFVASEVRSNRSFWNCISYHWQLRVDVCWISSGRRKGKELA